MDDKDSEAAALVPVLDKQMEVDEANESQESLNLIIDEKSNATVEDGQAEEEDGGGCENRQKNCADSNDEATVEARTDAMRKELIDTVDKIIANACSTGTEPVEVSDDDEVETRICEVQNTQTQTNNTNNTFVTPEEVPVIEIDDEEENDRLQTQNEKVKNETSELQKPTIKDTHEEVPNAIENNVPDTIDSETISLNTLSTSTNVLLKELPPRERTPELEVNNKLEDTTELIYTNKECINHECLRSHKHYFQAPQFALSQYKIPKKKFKRQYICSDCYDESINIYEKYCNLLQSQQPLLLNDVINGRPDYIEIIDSSDEENSDSNFTPFKDDKYLKKSETNLIEEELESTVKNILNDIDIQKQLTWCKTILNTRLSRICEENVAIENDIRELQKKADNIHASLYQFPKIKLRQLSPLDLNTGRSYSTLETFSSLPPTGEVQRQPIQMNDTYYAVKNKAIASWVPCKVVEPVDSGFGAQKNLKHYKVKFLKSQYSMLKTVSDKHLAYYDPPKVQLPIGTRVIAYFDATCLTRGKEKLTVQSAFYPGIIAEPLKYSNRYRYLIFYDDGYTQYVCHDDVRLVCHVSENVWEDVHPGSRDFIQKYLTQYSINRPMVQTQKGQSMATESNGKWNYARVIDIDCSLIQMQFEGLKTTEWIYRGSLRLGPVFKEYQKSMQKNSLPTSRLPRRTEPFIRYTEDEESSTNQQQQRQQRERNVEARAVARKSVSRHDSNCATSSTHAYLPTIPPVRHLNNSTIYVEDENKPKGKVVFYTAKRHLPPRTYKPHKCSPTCLFKISHNLNSYSLLSKPLLSGWERLIMRQKIKKVIAYRSPCGLILRNMKELHKYLLLTENSLNVDNFDFSPDIQCLAEYVIESAFVSNRDISEGQENMAIPLVNYYDNTMPQDCKYSAKRIPTEGVNLNLNTDFLVGCDCEDDCSNKEKCSCWQLTYAGAKYGNPNTPKDEIGYQYKRLHEHVPTGIYECNSRCKCKSNCLNRVAQQPLQMKLQVFKTSNRGWGLRGLNDIPRGSFICIYAGHLLTEAKANEGGLDAGDEYFAELDYIEVAEQIKEGYESDVELEPDEEDETYTPHDDDDDDDFTPNKTYVSRSKKTRRSSANRSNQDTDSQERQVINFNPNTEMGENSLRESSIRTLFGKDEACYVMDAKITGNLGRYFNHSCSPNLFVQNVFVDTHDLRFPWVAFFAMTNIRAGTELTWNYNYEVGVVPGKVLYCECGAPNCRLRLL